MERAAKILCGNGDFVPLQQPPARTTAMSEAIGHAAVLLGITRFDGPRQGSHLGWTPAELSTALDLGAERPAVFGSWEHAGKRALRGSLVLETQQIALLQTAGI